MAIIRKELDCECCGANDCDDNLITMLNDAQALASEYADRYVVFNINSGYRCEMCNQSVGGSPTSSHMTGYAADIAVGNSVDRLYMIKGLFDAGFERVGVYSTFIHADVDPTKSPACWYG